MKLFQTLALGLVVLLLADGCGRKKKETGTGAAAPAAAPAVTYPAKETRALWVWQNDAIRDAAARTELLAFCRAHRVNTLYFFVGDFPDHQYNPEYIAGLKELTRSAHREGLVIHALFGRSGPRLALRENHYEAVTLIRDFLKYNHGLPLAERFDALQAHVEPHQLPNWEENADGIQQGFLELIVEYRKTVLEFDTDLPLGLAVPARYAYYDWMSEVFAHAQYAAMWCDADDAETILQKIGPALRLAGGKGIPIAAGVETADLMGSGGSAGDTFFEEGPGALEAALSVVATALQADTAFGGIAIHDYASYRAMTQAAPRAEAAPEPPAAP